MTEEDLRRINETRRLRGLPPLTFAQAAKCWNDHKRENPTVDTSLDYITGYLIAAQIFSPSSAAAESAASSYSGEGGSFGGGGASADYSSSSSSSDSGSSSSSDSGSSSGGGDS